MQIDRVISKGQLVQLTFMQDGVAINQTDVQLPVSEVSGPVGIAVDGYVMPFAGEIIAISARLETAGSAGTLTIGPTVNGTEVTDPTLSMGTSQSLSDTCLRGTSRFAAGALIGAEITTNGTWNGTGDLAVSVFVILEIEGI